MLGRVVQGRVSFRFSAVLPASLCFVTGVGGRLVLLVAFWAEFPAMGDVHFLAHCVGTTRLQSVSMRRRQHSVMQASHLSSEAMWTRCKDLVEL